MSTDVNPPPIRLREWRAWKALSQEQLAGLSGVGKATIARIEGRHLSPRPSTIQKLARALSVMPEDLYRSPYDRP